MSNVKPLGAIAIGQSFDPAAARRQFVLSLLAGLGVLAVAAISAMQPARTAAYAANPHHIAVSAPQFVVWPTAVQQTRRSAGLEEG